MTSPLSPTPNIHCPWKCSCQHPQWHPCCQVQWAGLRPHLMCPFSHLGWGGAALLPQALHHVASGTATLLAFLPPHWLLLPIVLAGSSLPSRMLEGAFAGKVTFEQKGGGEGASHGGGELQTQEQPVQRPRGGRVPGMPEHQ